MQVYVTNVYNSVVEELTLEKKRRFIAVEQGISGCGGMALPRTGKAR